MGLIEFIVILALIGFAVYLITTYVPMPAPIKMAIVVIAILVIVVVFLRALGLDIAVPKIR